MRTQVARQLGLAKIDRRKIESLLAYIATAIAVFCIVQTIWSGRDVLGRFNTDLPSERQAVEDATSIAKGAHRVGIVSYAHYPNGPSYILVPAVKLGITEWKMLREIPFWIAVLFISCLILMVLRKSASPAPKLWALVSLSFIFHQQGIRYWMGALHYHSYAMSLSFLLLGIAFTVRNARVLLGAMGFVAGWIGYDPLPAMVLSFAAVRWIYRSSEGTNLKKAFYGAFWDTACLGGGMAAAVFAHLIQNVVFFGGWEPALRDLIGSAGARMGVSAISDLNPEYARNMDEVRQTLPDQNRFQVWVGVLQLFIPGGWMRIAPLILISVSGLGLLAWMRPWKRHATFAVRAGVFAAVILAASAAWSFLMPDHARCHPHFVPRHFFIPLVAIVLAPLIWSKRPGHV